MTVTVCSWHGRNAAVQNSDVLAAPARVPIGLWASWTRAPALLWPLRSLHDFWRWYFLLRRLKFTINHIKNGHGTFSSLKASTSFPLSPTVFPENRTRGTAPIVTRSSKFRMPLAELQPVMASWCKLFCRLVKEPSSQLQVAFWNKDDVIIQINVTYTKHTCRVTDSISSSPPPSHESGPAQGFCLSQERFSCHCCSGFRQFLSRDKQTLPC